MPKNIFIRPCRIVDFFAIFLCVFAGVELWGQPDEEFQPDAELVRKIVMLPFSEAKSELDHLPDQEKIQYSMFFAAVQMTEFKNNHTALKFCDYAQKAAESKNLPTGKIYFTKAYIYEQRNDRENSIDCLEKAAVSLRDANDIDLLKPCLAWMSSITYNYGYFEKAKEANQELYLLCIKTSDTAGKAKALFDMGEVHYRLGHFVQARDSAEQAMILFKEQDDRKGIADCLKLSGNVLSAQDKREEAIAYYIQACGAYEKAEDPHGQGNCNFNLGIMSIETGRNMDAIAYLEKAQDFYRQSKSELGVGIAQMEMGRAYHHENDFVKAEACFAKSEYSLMKNSKHRLAQMKDYFGDLRKSQKKPEQALTLYRVSADLYHKINLMKDEERVKSKIRELQRESR